jgi:formate hydrogenlyase subunit 3/multisubunit Na+/H+ antiporter MnhD subunit
MISLASFLGLLGLIPTLSGALLLLCQKVLPRSVVLAWCVAVLLACLAVVLLLIRLLTFGDTIPVTAFAPQGWARWLQLSYLVDAFNVFSALVIGVLASALVALLIWMEPAQADSEQPTAQQRALQRHSHTWQVGILLIGLGAIFTLIFANSALWLVLGWGVLGLCAFALYSQGQDRRQSRVLLLAPCASALVLYLALLPAITTSPNQRLDLLSGLGHEPFWGAALMLVALLAPGIVLLTRQARATNTAVPPASMSQSAAFVLMAAPATFTAFARLALLIAGPGAVVPGIGSTGWLAFSLLTVWGCALLALWAAFLAFRQGQRASLPLFLSVQLVSWMLAGVAITGAAALNGALLLKLLRLLALGALLLAGARKPAQPVLGISWWLAALALSALPFFPAFSAAWMITSGAIAAGPAWVAGAGADWLALLLITLAIFRVGSAEPAGASELSSGVINRVEAGPGFLLFVLVVFTAIAGIAPEAAVSLFTSAAAASLPVISSQLAGVQPTPVGLVTPFGAWLPGVFWILLVALLLLGLVVARPARQAAALPPFLGGEAEAGETTSTLPGAGSGADLTTTSEQEREPFSAHP